LIDLPVPQTLIHARSWPHSTEEFACTLAVLFVLFDRAVAGEFLCRVGPGAGVDQRLRDVIHIRIQQRNGRKTITTLSGVPTEYDPKKLLKAFKINLVKEVRTLESLQEFLRVIFGGDSREGRDGLAVLDVPVRPTD
jgi:hypothetical protein